MPLQSDNYESHQTDRIKRKKTSDACLKACSLVAKGEVDLERMRGRAEKLIAGKSKAEALISIVIAHLEKGGAVDQPRCRAISP